MGEVFAAENIRTGRHVAVKLLRADSKTKASAVERFRREARAAGSINSDHVTQVLDVEDDPDHGIVLVFELLEGESLIDRLKRTGPIPFEELHPIIEQVWMGLADAHRVGIIHRDLKPSNVFLERRPDGQMRVKILDFGISKLPKEMGGETLTEMGQSLGTFSFMPPEQIGKAKTVDHRADIYACATLIYQALSGQLPYTARNILVMVELKSKTDPRSLSEAMEGPVDSRLEAFLSRGLAREPGDRFQSAVEALASWRELRPQQAGVGASASTPPPLSGPPRLTTPVASTSPVGASSRSSASSPSAHATPPGNPSRPSHIAPQSARAQQGSHSATPVPRSVAPPSERARPHGGTLAMETTFDTTAPTTAMPIVHHASQVTSAEPPQLRPVSPAIMTGHTGGLDLRSSRPAQAPQGGFQDPRNHPHGQFGSNSGYPQASAPTQGPYSQPGHQGAPSLPLPVTDPSHKAPEAYDERISPPDDEAKTGHFYKVSAPGSAQVTSPSTPAPVATSLSTPAPVAIRPARASSLRIILSLIALALVGFGIVTALYILKLI